MLGQHPLREVRELAEKVKARETDFLIRLNERDHRVRTHYIPEILNGMTLLKFMEP